MKIEYKKGDFLEGPEIYVLHGCNCLGVMGSGAAKAVKEKYPDAYRLYCMQHAAEGLLLGDLQYSIQDNGVTVFNGMTQNTYGRNPKVLYVSYHAIREVIRNVNVYVSSFATDMAGPPRVAMPRIGAGTGNGDWDIISQIIQENSPHFQPVVYELD